MTFRQTIECGFTLKLVCDMIITYSQMRDTDKHSQHSSIIWLIWLNGLVFIYELSGCGFESCCSHLNFRYGACLRQTIECGFTLKLVHDMIITYNQMQCTGKYSQQSSIIWPVWLNGWVFVYKLSGCGFKSRWCQ